MSSVAWDKNVAWLDIGLASAAFLAECGPGIVLVSLEVAVPSNRYLEVHFQIDRKPGSMFWVGCSCGSMAAVPERVAIMARQARTMREMA